MQLVVDVGNDDCALGLGTLIGRGYHWSGSWNIDSGISVILTTWYFFCLARIFVMLHPQKPQDDMLASSDCDRRR